MRQQKNICLFCRSAGPFTRKEHPIPESLGNDDAVIPPGFVCDKCNQYFGAKIERSVLDSPPFNIERMAAAIKTKKGKYAKYTSVDAQFYSTGFWDQVFFHGSKEWYANTFPTSEGGILWVDRPMDQRSPLSRFLLKMGLELLLLADGHDPYGSGFDRARLWSRFGDGPRNWQVGYTQYPDRKALVKNKREDEFGPLETRQIYQYEMGEMANGDVILCFAFITHIFACNLSQPCLQEYVEGFNRVNPIRMMLMP